VLDKATMPRVSEGEQDEHTRAITAQDKQTCDAMCNARHEQCNEAIANRFLATAHVQQLGKLAFLQGMGTELCTVCTSWPGRCGIRGASTTPTPAGCAMNGLVVCGPSATQQLTSAVATLPDKRSRMQALVCHTHLPSLQGTQDIFVEQT
jgi:hypothetical protein